MRVRAWDRDAHFEPSVIAKLAELGFLGMMVPEEFDGLGLETLTYLVALEEIAAVDASTAVLMSVHNSLPTQMLLRWGSADQKSRYLRTCLGKAENVVDKEQDVAAGARSVAIAEVLRYGKT